MKKILFICIGLTILIFIILIRLYSESVVSFVNEVTHSSDTLENKEPITLVSKLDSSGTDDDEDEEEPVSDGLDEYDEEYIDTVIRGIDTLIIKVNPTYVDGIVYGNQKIKPNVPVKFKITENIEVKEKFVPANTIFYAIPEIKNSNVNLSVNTFQTKRGVVLLSLHALNEDLVDVMSTNSANEMTLNDGDTILFDY